MSVSCAPLSMHSVMAWRGSECTKLPEGESYLIHYDGMVGLHSTSPAKQTSANPVRNYIAEPAGKKEKEEVLGRLMRETKCISPSGPGLFNH